MMPMLRRSISYPEVLVSSDGEFFSDLTGQKLDVVENHNYNIRGPVVNLGTAKKARMVAAMRMVYEAHIKKERVSRVEFIEAIDGNDNNIKASNLRKFVKGISDKKEKSDYDGSWMNGIDGVYL